MGVIYNERDTVYAPPGEAVSDEGASYATVQEAINNSQNWTLVGPGEFGSASITSDGFTLIGSGASSELKGGTSTAITVSGDNCTIRSLAVETTPNGGNPADGIQVNADNANVSDIAILNSDRHGVRTSGLATGNLITNIYPGGSDTEVDETFVSLGAGPNLVGSIIISGCQVGVDSEEGDFNVIANVVVSSAGEGIVAGGVNIISGFDTTLTDNDSIRVEGDGAVLSAGSATNVTLNADRTKLSNSVSVLGSITDNGDNNTIGNRLISPPTISLGGADGSITVTGVELEHYTVFVDAGGSASVLEGIDGPTQTGVTVTVQRKGGENVTLSHNDGNATNPLLNQGLADIVLDSSDQMVTYQYDGSDWREIYSNIV